jgi:hypothetical protein
MGKPAKDVHERDPEFEHIFETVSELHDRIAKIRPDLIVSVQFGDKLNRSPGVSSDDDPPFPPGGPSFRDFENAPEKPFVNAFAKAGDGFINIHGIDLAGRVEVLPGINLKQIKSNTKPSGE